MAVAAAAPFMLDQQVGALVAELVGLVLEQDKQWLPEAQVAARGRLAVTAMHLVVSTGPLESGAAPGEVAEELCPGLVEQVVHL